MACNRRDKDNRNRGICMYDPNKNRFGDPEDQFSRPPANSSMTTAAIACAIIGIITVMTGFIAIIFGSLAIIFAILSRGADSKPSRVSRYAFIVGLIAVLISVVIIIHSLAVIIQTYGSLENYYNTYLYTIEQYYGLDPDTEEILQITPTDFNLI